MRTPIHVAVSTDEKYIQHTTVCLYSVAANTVSRVVATILFDEICDESKERLARSLAPLDVELRFKQIDSSQLSDLPILSRRMSIAAYFRLLLPHLTDDDVSRIIYLDSDIVCRDDLTPLWHADLHGRTVGAVREATFQNGLTSRFNASATGIVPLNLSFNSGVMVIDIESWKGRRVTERALEWRRSNRTSKLHDQDALNFALHGDWAELSARWNFAGFFRTTGYILEKNRVRLNPAVLHFGGASAPWEHTTHPYAYLYHENLRKTEWRDFEPPRASARELFDRRLVEFKWALRKLHYALWPHSYGAATEYGGMAGAPCATPSPNAGEEGASFESQMLNAYP